MADNQLARMEAKQDAMLEELRRFIEAQSEHNEAFYKVRDHVLEIKAKSQGAWFVFSLFGTITVAVSGFVAWVVSNLKG